LPGLPGADGLPGHPGNAGNFINALEFNFEYKKKVRNNHSAV